MFEYYNQIVYSNDPRYSIVIDGDDRVVYIYLLFEENITSDVWLCNQIESPKSIDFNDREQMPFLNPDEFIKESMRGPFYNLEPIDIRWRITDHVKGVFVHFFSGAKIVLELGCTPGWSNCVKKSGPLALELDEERVNRIIRSED